MKICLLLSYTYPWVRNMNNMIIGKQIQYYRTRSALTLRELGDQIGVSKQCLSGWEHGRNMPDAISLYKLAKIFDIAMEKFYIEDDYISETTPNNDCVSETPLKPYPEELSLTPKETQLIYKLRSMNTQRRKAVEVLFGVNNIR